MKTIKVSDLESSRFNVNDLIVFSHLRWQFVTQRPQHILTRMAKSRKVIFVEEPIGADKSYKRTVKSIKDGNVTILQPRIDNSRLALDLHPILNTYITKLKVNKPIFWFYTAAYIDILNHFEPELTVYDCMDELNNFKGASNELLKQERTLLSLADIVFTGGKSLFEAKSNFNSNVHCFPSSVDQKHFVKALKKETKVALDLKTIPQPIVVYYGVIDERIDLKLLEKTAEKLPNVSFVMIGPVVKIAPEDLPKSNNIYYLGSKDYKKLPNYLKAFDICMMPFALNKSTKFISPTKTLEYMVALKPIISTPIYDVVRDYAKEVKIVRTAESFANAITSYLTETLDQRLQRQTLQQAVIDKTSWDTTVMDMNKLLEQALEERTEKTGSMVEQLPGNAKANSL